MLRTALRAGCCLLTFSVGLAAASLAILSRVPGSSVPVVTDKLACLEAGAGKFDTLFVGSSRVRRQISPRIFDARLHELGIEAHSLNLGIDAMTFPELPYFFDRVLEVKLPRLQRVFFDLNALRRKIDPANDRHSPRATYWHDWKYTLLVCRALFRDPGGAPRSAFENGTLLFQHVQMMIWHYSTPGRGALLLQHGLDRSQKTVPGDSLANALGRDRDGFFPIQGTLTGAVAAEFQKALAEMKALPNRPNPRDPIHEKALAELVAKVEAAGARAFFLVSPTVTKARPVLPQGATVLDFEDPETFPSLYDPAHRYDVQHLNATGAAEYSAAIADRVGALSTPPRP